MNGLNKQLLHSCNGILFSIKEEQIAEQSNIVVLKMQYKKQDSTSYSVPFHLCSILEKAKLSSQKSLVVAKALGWESRLPTKGLLGTLNVIKRILSFAVCSGGNTPLYIF